MNLLIEVSDVATSMTMEETPESPEGPHFPAEENSISVEGYCGAIKSPLFLMGLCWWIQEMDKNPLGFNTAMRRGP